MLAIMAVVATLPAAAQDEMPPLPRPRPDLEALRSSGITPAPGTSATEAITAATSQPQPVLLTAQVVEDGAAIPDGLVWRIFDSHADAQGDLALVYKSDEAMAALDLPPGEYLVHVSYGRAQASENLSVKVGQNRKIMILDAGGLRLHASVTGDVPIPPALLHFDIFTAGSESNRTLIAENIAANDVVTLNAGTYHIVSYFGDVNATVRADLRVEPGQLTDATLYHKAAQVAFKLVSEAGGEAIADVEWTVKTATGETVFSDLGPFPATVLAEGDYLVLAKRGESVFNREFQVIPGATREIEVMTSVY